MFGKSAPKERSISIPAPPPKLERKEQSFLQNGVRIEGIIDVQGDLRVEGAINGTVNVKGVLMIGPGADAQGSINGGEVVIHGKVTGDVRSETRIQLCRGADVTGDLYCRSLVIEEGVMFEGRSHMGEQPGHGGARVDDQLKKRQAIHGGSPNPNPNPNKNPNPNLNPNSNTNPAPGGSNKGGPISQPGQNRPADRSSQMSRGADKIFQK